MVFSILRRLAEHSRWFVAGKVYSVEMASSHSSSMNYAQERQLVLMETMNKRLDSILEGQKKLEEKNMNLQQENAKLKSQLERKTVQTGERSTRSSSKQSNVEIPNDLRVSSLYISSYSIKHVIVQ